MENGSATCRCHFIGKSHAVLNSSFKILSTVEREQSLFELILSSLSLDTTVIVGKN